MRQRVRLVVRRVIGSREPRRLLSPAWRRARGLEDLDVGQQAAGRTAARRRGLLVWAAALAGLGVALVGVSSPTATVQPAYHSPEVVAFAPVGGLLAVSDVTARSVAVVDARARRVIRSVTLAGAPGGLAWAPGGRRFYVADRGARAVAEAALPAGRVVRRLACGPRPGALALASRRQLLVVTDSGVNAVSLLSLASGREAARLPVAGQPSCVAVTPDESLAVVGSLLPGGRASDPTASAAVTLVDLAGRRLLASLPLPPGSALVRGVAVSPDGRWAYAVHTLGRPNVPTTQLERGWVNTNALSLADLRERKVYATVLLDNPTEGAADPWGVAVSRDGATLWIALSGVHQVARLNLARLHALLAGRLPDSHWLAKPSAEYTAGVQDSWLQIRNDPSQRALLVNDLTALSAADVIERVPLPGRGLRGLALSPDGKRLAAAAYFTGSVLLSDPATLRAASAVPLGPPREADLVRRGEEVFHDATYCFQHWLSCATCHPDARADGLNWDLLNDGLGNPKNTKSLLFSHRTPPVMSHGVRANMEVAAVAGFRFILFREPQAGEAAAVQAYLRSLRPEPSPYLTARGGLTASAARGKGLFESPKTRCSSCHRPPLLTNLRSYDVGTRSELDTSPVFDTPSLLELWRTAPYLHDGSAVTLEDVITRSNPKDRHGATSHLSPSEVRDLAAYLRSL